MTDKTAISLAVSVLVGAGIVTYNLPRENFSLTRVIDGDTIELYVDKMPSPLPKKLGLRIEGVDTPEKNYLAKCEKERLLGEKATILTQQLLNKSKDTEITIRGWGKYGGRVIGDVKLDGRLLSDILIARGLAARYDGTGTKKDWCDGEIPQKDSE